MKSPKLQLTAPNRFIGWAAVDEAMGQAAAGTALGRMVTEDDVAGAHGTVGEGRRRASLATEVDPR